MQQQHCFPLKWLLLGNLPCGFDIEAICTCLDIGIDTPFEVKILSSSVGVNKLSHVATQDVELSLHFAKNPSLIYWKATNLNLSCTLTQRQPWYRKFHYPLAQTKTVMVQEVPLPFGTDKDSHGTGSSTKTILVHPLSQTKTVKFHYVTLLC